MTRLVERFLAAGGTSVRVVSSAMTWNEFEGEKALPLWPTSPNGRAVSRTIFLEAVKEFSGHPARRSDRRVPLHMDQVGVCSPDGVVMNLATQNLYEIEGSSIRVQYIADSTVARLDVLQLVRGIMLLVEVDNGAIPVHCSAIAMGDAALALVGGAGAGKTSFGLASLAGESRFSYMTGDKALLRRDGSLVALPFSVSVSPGTLMQYPGLATTGARTLHEKTLIWPGRIGRYFDRPLRDKASLRSLILCQLDPSQAKVELRKAEPWESALAHLEFLKYNHATTPMWLAKRWGIEFTQRTSPDLFRKVPSFVIEGGAINSARALNGVIGDL